MTDCPTDRLYRDILERKVKVVDKDGRDIGWQYIDTMTIGYSGINNNPDASKDNYRFIDFASAVKNENRLTPEDKKRLDELRKTMSDDDIAKISWGYRGIMKK